MNGHIANTTSRREILRGALPLALDDGCVTSIRARAAIRGGRAVGKPLLIEPEVNRMIPSPQNRQAYLAVSDFAKRDLFCYVTANFHLTPQQTGVEADQEENNVSEIVRGS